MSMTEVAGRAINETIMPGFFKRTYHEQPTLLPDAQDAIDDDLRIS